MSKVGGLDVHKVGVITFILNRLLVFNMFFVITSNFGRGGLSPPLSKSGGAQAPPAPQVLCLCDFSAC